MLFPFITTIAQILELWRQSPILTMAVKDNKGISFEREALIAEIHAQSASLCRKDLCDHRDRKFSISNARIAGNATIAGKLNKTVSISTQRSLVTNLCDPCVASDPCDQMETRLYSQRSTNISAIVKKLSVLFVSLRNSRVDIQTNTFILRKGGENLCDMAYQKYCKIVVSKEVCCHYMTQPL